MNSKSASITVAVILIALILSPFLYTVIGNGLSTSAVPDLVLPTTSEVPDGKCVEPTAYMRANHMKLLIESRDNTVRKGIRKVSHSLHNCSTCHQKREEFCDKCHDYVGAKPNCFGCHYYP